MVVDGRTDRGDDKDLLNRIEELEKENAALAVRNVTLQAESTTLRIRSDALNAEVERLREQVAETDAARPGITFNQLGSQIRQALNAIEDVGDGSTRYVARSAEFELKGAFDSENEELVLRLPGLTQRVDPGLLGSMRIEMRGGDTGGVDVSDLVLVPTLLGMTELGAGNRLAAAGLVIGQAVERESVKSVGTIIGQDPLGGSYVPPGTAIDIVVASAQVTVPDLSGRDVERAALELAQRGLMAGEIRTRRSDSVAGTVVAQKPKAGSTVDRDTAVDLTVAEEQTVAVPGVIGMAFDEATARLAAVGLDAGPLTQEPSEKPRGIVLGQKPVAGTQMAVGSRIALVTAGPLILRARPVTDVVGSSRIAAVEALGGAGFTAWIEAASPRGGIGPGTFDTVLSQVPAAGTLSADATTTIKVVAAVDPVTAVRGIGPQAAAALRRARITSVGTLAFAAPDTVAEALGTSTDNAAAFIAAAGVINDAVSLEPIEGIDRAAALALAGAGIRRPSDLAAQDPVVLARTLQAARRSGVVGSGLTLDRPTVTEWVEAANRYGSG